jgi:hypothetical protein
MGMTLRVSTALRNAIAGSSVNLISNGEFESGISPWGGTNYTLGSDAGILRSGNYVQLTGGHLGVGFTPIVGANYLASLWIRPVTGNVNFSTLISFPGTGAAYSFVAGYSDQVADWGVNSAMMYEVWSQFRKMFTAATNSGVITVSGGTSQGIYFDGVAITQVPTTLADILSVSNIDPANFGTKLLVYSGAQPATADAAPTGTLVATVLKAGLPLTWIFGSDGSVAKQGVDAWTGACSTGASLGWFRICMVSDPLTLDTTGLYPRIDGSVGLLNSSEDLKISATTVNTGDTLSVWDMSFKLPLNL